MAQFSAVSRALALVVLLAGHASGAPGDDTRTTFQRATESQALQRYEAAARFFQTFIDSSVGDPDVPNAQRLLHDATAALAKEWAAQGREAEAARLYLWLAKDPLTPDESKEQFVKEAAQVLSAALTDARQKHLFARALRLQKDYAGIFPDKPALLTPQEAEDFAAEGLLAACKDKFNLMALPDVARDYYPDRDPPWEELAKRNHNESLQLGYLRSLSEVGWAGRFLAEYERLPADSPLRNDQALTKMREKMLLARAQGWVAQGNLATALEAVDAAKALIVGEPNLSTVKSLQAGLAGKVVGDPRPLAFPGTVSGKVLWQDPGAGFKDASDVTLDSEADVTVRPGFFLDGGVIELQRGRLRLKGTPSQPIVFRNVSIDSEIGSVVEAENTLFIGCTFSKTGGRPFAGSRWNFSGCVLYRSRFSQFGPAEYNVHIDNCAWVECAVPNRMSLSADLASALRDRRTRLANCLFYRSAIAPSVTWGGDECNFVRCQITRQNEFDSLTSLSATLFAPLSDPIGADLRAGTLICNKGDLRYGFVAKPFGINLPPQLWALLPVEEPASPKAAAPRREGE